MASDSLLYRGKYRRPTNRAQWWDWYEGIYFVTLNTQNRRHDFGEIEWDVKRHKKIMCHSAIGKFADEEIPKIMEHHPYAYIPSWIVMPDHIHLIIMIDVRGRIKNYSFDDSAVRTARRDYDNDEMNHDEINHDSAVRTARRDESCVRFDNDISKRMSEIAPKHGSLGSVIGQYKRAITMYARMNHLPLQWQSNYYASILKDQHGFDCVRRYIDNNVSKWEIKP